MAEEASVLQIVGLDKQFESLLSRYTSDQLRADGKPLCSDFCKLVEEFASRWQVPLPQLRVLEIALRYFARASTFFTLNCDHVLNTLSSLALSVFELLLFFDQTDFHQEPLKRFTVTFQECYSSLARHQNVHLLQVERLLWGGGPWAGPALQAIISESSLPQSAVDECIGSELPVFFELRVRYLLSCERVSEALALAKCCAHHPTAGQHLFFLQVYLTWLLKTSQHDRLHREVAEFNGKDAVHIICSLDCEETDELLLALSRAFLTQQLRRGDMYYLCDLVFIWSKLHSRMNTSKQALLEESHQLMLSATNVNSIFPFIRAILQELGEDGIQFCVELCAKALGSCRSCDVITKSLIYKTIAGLLPNDLEVSRACALLVFFLECTVETYKMVYLLYMHPDQEYHVESSPIKNHIRFETLQVLKKDLYFDPEFWNLIALRTNCLKLMSEKVVSGSLEEIMEDKWILSYSTKEAAPRSCTSICQKESNSAGAKKRHHKQDRHHKDDAYAASKRLKVGPGKTRLNVDHTVKKKGIRGRPSEPLRRSFWQLERLQDSGVVGRGELRRTTRLSEKNPPKRRIRTPKWLLEDSGTLGENNALPKIKKHGLRPQKHHDSSVVKRPEMGELKNNAKLKPSFNSHGIAREKNSKHRKGFLLDSPKPASAPRVILELSLPDNELMGTFADDSCHRQRGIPQVLLYRPTVKVPAASQPVKTGHRNEVILRARDAVMFIQQLHCYARRQKGKGNGPNIQGSVSTITRSSVQGSPPKDPQKELCEMSAAEMKGGVTSQMEAEVFEKAHHAQTTKAVSRKIISGGELSEKASEMKVSDASQTSAATEAKGAPIFDKVLQAQTVASTRELCEESAVEMKVTIASTAANVTHSPDLEKVSKAVKDGAQISQTVVNSQMVATDKICNMADISNTGAADPMPSQSQDTLRDRKQELKSLSPQTEMKTAVLTTVGRSISEVDVPVSPKLSEVPCENDINGGTVATNSPGQDSVNEISALASGTEMVTELAPEPLTSDVENPEEAASEESTAGSKSKSHATSSCSIAADVQEEKEKTQDFGQETPGNSEIPESEESHLEYSCTFCTKVFKGRRVVAHAMFHYRKDECMFCGTMFKDDLLAMMHLSDHIEKLKRSKDTAGNKDISTPKPCAKDKSRNMSSQCWRRGSKSAKCPKTVSLSGSRELRSNGKPVQEENVSKHLSVTAPLKVNGHIGRKKELHRPKKDTLNSEAQQPLCQQEISQERTKNRAERLQENKGVEMDSSAASTRVDKKHSCSKELATKQSREDDEKKNVEPGGKLCCPVEGCDWFTDRSKTRVAFLYHALEDHHGELKPLELAFRLGNNKCSSCMRVMWSFEHFQHHVERHRLAPRHPCLHQGCTARFKSGMEMRRHARRHSPLQAVCCLPGCPHLFICLWALNLHEREHYTCKPTKSAKNTNEQTSDKHDTPDGKKQVDHVPKDRSAARKLKGESVHISTGDHVQAPLPAASLLKRTNETKDSHVLKNLSNKDTSTQPTGPVLRLRQRLRKVQNAAKSHKVILSSLLKHNIKVRHKLKKKQVKMNTTGPERRGRPPKVKTAGADENTTTGQSNHTVVEKPAHLAAETSNVTESKDKKSQEVQDVVKTKSTSKWMKNINVELKEVSHNTSTATVIADSLDKPQTAKTRTIASDKMKNLHKGRKRSALTGSGDSSRSKKHKAANSKANAEVVKESEGKTEQENTDTTQSDNPASAVPAESSTVRAANTSGEKTQTTETRKLHKTKEEKKVTPTTSSDSGTTKKKHKDVNEKGEKEKSPCKDVSKTSALENKSAAADGKQDEAKEAAAAESSPDESCGSSVPSMPAEQSTQKVTKKKSKVTKTSENPTKANRKRDTKPVKKICKDKGVGSVKSKAAALNEVKAGESPGYCAMTNGQAAREDIQSSTFKEALAEYRKKPYMRPPPTVYLDEKYITMPKRRKELSIFQSYQQSYQSCVTPAQPRQRCANCFATFDSAEDLQSHLQLQKCSNLFGFDSDDEGSMLML